MATRSSRFSASPGSPAFQNKCVVTRSAMSGILRIAMGSAEKHVATCKLDITSPQGRFCAGFVLLNRKGIRSQTSGRMPAATSMPEQAVPLPSSRGYKLRQPRNPCRQAGRPGRAKPRAIRNWLREKGCQRRSRHRLRLPSANRLAPTLIAASRAKIRAKAASAVASKRAWAFSFSFPSAASAARRARLPAHSA